MPRVKVSPVKGKRPIGRREAPPSVLPDISPTRGEIGSPAEGAALATAEACSALSALDIDEGGDESSISPLVGEMSGRTERGASRKPVEHAQPARDANCLA